MGNNYNNSNNNSDFVFFHSCISKLEKRAVINVSEVAKEIGINLPILVTSSVWTKYIQWTRQDISKPISPESKDRLRDVLRILAVWLKYHNVAQTNFEYQDLLYDVFAIHRSGVRMELITLKAVFSKNDNLKPVIMIMLESED